LVWELPRQISAIHHAAQELASGEIESDQVASSRSLSSLGPPTERPAAGLNFTTTERSSGQYVENIFVNQQILREAN